MRNGRVIWPAKHRISDLVNEHRLYVRNWTLQDTCQALQEDYTAEDVESCPSFEYCVYTVASRPVAIALAELGGVFAPPSISVYVKPSFRRRGVGSRLIRSLKRKLAVSHFNYGDGVVGSDRFFSQLLG